MKGIGDIRMDGQLEKMILRSARVLLPLKQQMKAPSEMRGLFWPYYELVIKRVACV